MITYFLSQLLLLQYAFTAEVFIACASMILLLLGIKRGDKSAVQIAWVSTFILLASLFIITKVDMTNNPASYFFKVNYFIMAIKIVIIISAVISLILYIGHLNYNVKIARFEYPIILLMSVLGMLVLISANDFLTLYMGLELQSLALYILVSINRENLKSLEAGIKYFILGALASGIMLYGISLIYGFSGTIFFTEIKTLFSNGVAQESYLGVTIGIVLVMTAFFFKISAVPFHMWTPDVYEGSPTPVTVFISTVPKVAVFFIFLRVLIEPLGGFVSDWQQIIMFVAVTSLIIGALGAIRQVNIKRLIAYSTINHIGFILLGILVFNGAGIQAMLIYAILYLTITFGAFAFLMIVKQSHSSADMADKKPLEDITAYAGLSKTMPITAIGMTILLFSMAGIPPFAGFFGKFFIFKVVIDAGYYKVAIIAAISSVIAMYYYLKIVKIMFFDKEVESYDKNPALPTAIIYGLVVCFNLVFFVRPNLFFDISYFSEKFFF